MTRSTDRPICSCGKRCFATKAEARARFPKKKAYRCPFSDQYHVKSKVSTQQRGTFGGRGGTR